MNWLTSSSAAMPTVKPGSEWFGNLAAALSGAISRRSE
jgi:hypothetical protein